jgi:hypothetical protein
MGDLPKFLQSYWSNKKTDPRDKENYCVKQARKTPAIPWHNGHPECIACGADVT